MTTTYDPQHPEYADEAGVRSELTRVFDVCVECRRCVDLCGVFPTLFDLVDRHPADGAGRLTPAQQDRVADQCTHCSLCAVDCPYTPDIHESAVHVPRLMVRAHAMRRASGQVPVRVRLTDTLLGRTDLLGRVAGRAAPAMNRLVDAKPGSTPRRLLEKATGVSKVRVLPPYARQRFSTWFAGRPKVRIAKRQGRVAVYPTCLVEYQQPAIGHDLVKVYERNGIECRLADDVGCCGAPWLHAGDVVRFTKVAERNVAALAAMVRKGHDIVVPQPTCGYVLQHEYPHYLGSADARTVAERTYDAVEFLMQVHKGDATTLDSDFSGFVPSTITYHVACHVRSQQVGLKGRDLMRLTGATVKLVQRCSGMGGAWGLRAANADSSVPRARALADDVHAAGGDLVAGDCHLANTAITEQTGEIPLHPLQVLARAYGIPEEA